jgi:hypothetical protein
MRLMMTGLTSWARMRASANEEVKVVDTAITVVATLLAVTSWVVLHG